MVFSISDQKLNQFLREQNGDLFDTFAFSFEDDYLIVDGQQSNIKATIKGRYTLENTPENLLRFTVDEMTFNDFLLDETTKQELQSEFYETLAFHPQRILPQIVATGVSIKRGFFTITLKFSS